MEWKQVSIPKIWFDLLEKCARSGVYKSVADAVLHALRMQIHHFKNVAAEWEEAQETMKKMREVDESIDE